MTTRSLSMFLFAMTLYICGRCAHSQVGDQKLTEERVDTSAEAGEADILTHVPKVYKVEHMVQTSDPPNLVVTAYGQVRSGGWKQVQLIRRTYVTPPADGIWEYDLLGKQPTGGAAAVITNVRARNTWRDFDVNIKGVRIYGEASGVLEVILGKASGN